MNEFSYVRPATLDEMLTLLDPGGGDAMDGSLLAGGTDLLPLIKESIAAPQHLIDIKRLPELDGNSSVTKDGVRIGALTTLAQLQTDPVVLANGSALAHAAGVAATPQLRHMATLGGNLLQHPRCWYFRSRDVPCWRKEGDRCPAADDQGENQYHALFGDGPCHAVHPSDPATALLALGACVRVQDRRGDKSIPLDEFFTLPTDSHRQEHQLPPGSVITAVEFPLAAPGSKSVYLKAMDRAAWAFALVGVAAHITMADDIITDARLVLGGVAPIPWRVKDAESVLIGNRADAAAFSRAADVALERAHPLTKNGYKVELAKRLIERALVAATT